MSNYRNIESAIKTVRKTRKENCVQIVKKPIKKDQLVSFQTIKTQKSSPSSKT